MSPSGACSTKMTCPTALTQPACRARRPGLYTPASGLPLRQIAGAPAGRTPEQNARQGMPQMGQPDRD